MDGVHPYLRDRPRGRVGGLGAARGFLHRGYWDSKLSHVFAQGRDRHPLSASLRAVAVLNAADPQGHDNEAAAALLRDNDALELTQAILIRRKAFPNAAAGGLSVIECGDSKARAEFERLSIEIDKLYTNDIGKISYGNRTES